MKVIEFIKKYQLVLFLSFLVIVLIILKIIYGNKEIDQIKQTIPTPTPILQEVKPETVYEVLNDGNPDYPLKKVLPYNNDNFSVIGYDEPFTLLVRLKSGSKTEAEKEIRQWIEKNIPGDTEHKIIFAN